MKRLTTLEIYRTCCFVRSNHIFGLFLPFYGTIPSSSPFVVTHSGFLPRERDRMIRYDKKTVKKWWRRMETVGTGSPSLFYHCWHPLGCCGCSVVPNEGRRCCTMKDAQVQEGWSLRGPSVALKTQKSTWNEISLCSVHLKALNHNRSVCLLALMALWGNCCIYSSVVCFDRVRTSIFLSDVIINIINI